MSTANDLYPNKFEDEYLSPICDYQPIINDFGKVVIQIDDKNYSGDSRILYDNDTRYGETRTIGILIFGWGSCSGCDALQACNSYAEVDKLIAELRNKILWFPDHATALAYATTHDWKGDYNWCDIETKRFVATIRAYLTSIPME